MLPPVLVPRYSEYPSHIPHNSMSRMMPQSSSFHHVSEPIMPYNVSYPHGFHGDRSSASGVPSPASSYGLPGRSLKLLYVCMHDSIAMKVRRCAAVLVSG